MSNTKDARTAAGLKPPALDPSTMEAVAQTGYPETFRASVAGRRRRRIGNALGLTHFGVNVATLDPGAVSAMRHWHTHEDELVYMLAGELVLVTDGGEQLLRPGMAAGFPAGRSDGHHLVNRSTEPATYLEIGDRVPGDETEYPDIDLAFRRVDGRRVFVHKDGTPY